MRISKLQVIVLILSVIGLSHPSFAQTPSKITPKKDSTARLRIINESNIPELPQIGITQQNIANSPGKKPSFWRIYSGIEHNQPISFPFTSQFNFTGLDYRNHGTKSVFNVKGKALKMINEKGTKKVIVIGNASNPNQIEFTNGTHEKVSGAVYRDYWHLATVGKIPPGRTGKFEFTETILLGMIPDYNSRLLVTDEEMELMKTSIDLTGVKSGDIVVRGGGEEPFTFSFENVIRE